jgi:murein DD-endopeptidase MepM/ murein hydrolase activator NlpD
MKKITLILLLMILSLSACVNNQRILTPTETPSPLPTLTHTPKPTFTATVTTAPTSTSVPYNRFTVPFSCADYEKVFIGSFFDHNKAKGEVRNYKGDTEGYTYSLPGTDDGHTGTDYHPVAGVDPSKLIVRAAADGIVIGSGHDFGNQVSGYTEGYVEIDHDPSTPRHGYITTYHHVIPSAEIGQEVKRGDPIGTLDLNEKRLVLHFDVWNKSGSYWNPASHEWGVQVDFFRDLFDNSSISLWTVDNEPQCSP